MNWKRLAVALLFENPGTDGTYPGFCNAAEPKEKLVNVPPAPEFFPHTYTYDAETQSGQWQHRELFLP